MYLSLRITGLALLQFDQRKDFFTTWMRGAVFQSSTASLRSEKINNGVSGIEDRLSTSKPCVCVFLDDDDGMDKG